MKQQEIDRNKAEYIALCRKHIRRDGLEELLAYLETTDFYTAPSSTNYHLNEAGGLCRHSMNVFRTAMSLYEHVAQPAIKSGDSPFTAEVEPESIAIATLFHDLCKMKIYHCTERWKKDEGGRWMSYPGYEVRDDFPMGHGEKSCFILSWYMKLTKDELLAIRWHMGAFDLAPMGTSQSYSYRAAVEQSPLVALVHSADFLSSNLLEKTTKH